MQFHLPLIALLIASTFALPFFSNIKRDVMMLELPADSGMPCIELFRNLCVGIAVCNPVTVTKGKGGEKPKEEGKDVCVGVAVCNPVTVDE